MAKISAQIERCRIEMGMTQQEFAEYMGVTQGMVSKWESREYNFTIKTLNDICQKVNRELSVELETSCVREDYKVVKWDSDIVARKRRKGGWSPYLSNKEAIA